MTGDRADGARIRLHRIRRGLTQPVLAGLVGISVSYLQKLERGDRTAGDLALLGRLARHLRVEVGDLLPSPAVAAAGRDQRVVAVADALLDQHLAVAPDGHGAVAARELARLRFQLEAAWRAVQAGTYSRAATLLPLVLGRITGLPPGADAGTRVLAASAHHAAAALLAHLGAADLAWVSAERGLRLAQEADQPVPVAALSRSVAHAVAASGRPEAALALTLAAAARSRAHLAAHPGPAMLSVHGTLLLNGAMAAARAGDRREARTLLDEAEATADRLGGDRNAAWTAFGPTNVAVHRVGVAVESDDVDLALRLAPPIATASLPGERRARFDLDVARAATRRGQVDVAVDRLLAADRAAPELLPVHRAARPLVADLLRGPAGRRREFVALAARLDRRGGG